jgi:hypothetical protein
MREHSLRELLLAKMAPASARFGGDTRLQSAHENLVITVVQDGPQRLDVLHRALDLLRMHFE